MHSDKISILIVDDVPENLTLLTDILKKAGFDVRQAKNGELALKTVAAKPPGLILLDIKMPDMDGYEVCRRLKDQERLKDIPVIFITALSDSTDKVRAFAAGGIDYIVKPLDPDEVVARVKTHLETRHHQNGLKREIQTLREGGLATSQTELQERGGGINLTGREKECLMWLSRGLRNDRIAEKVGIKPVTVQLHLDKARKRLDAATREQALTIAIQIGAIAP